MSNVVQFVPRFDREEEKRKLNEEITEIQRLMESSCARRRRLYPELARESDASDQRIQKALDEEEPPKKLQQRCEPYDEF